MRKNKKTVHIGLIGFGTVGSGVVKILQGQSKALEKKTGVRLVLKKIVVKSLAKKRAVKVSKRLLTRNASEVLNDPNIDIVVELIGGIHPAKETITKAFANGKHVVTANKALLAEQGSTIFSQAQKYSKQLGLEASVCAGIPIIQAITKGLVGNNITHFFGIMNGTCNYILSSMDSQGLAFDDVLKKAQDLGYAEKDPKLDIEGIDTAHKLAILARLAFHANIPFRSISTEGIHKLSGTDIQYAHELGYVVKLLAIGKKSKRGIELRVHPTLLPFDHPLSTVGGVYNAVFVHSDQAEDLLFYGKGAGMSPTASAVVSDIVDIAKSLACQNPRVAAKLKTTRATKLLPTEGVVSKYYLHFQVVDKPGVLGKIAQTLGKNGISILSVHQKESRGSKSVPVIIVTYQAREKNLREALRQIHASKDIVKKTVVMRIES